MGTHPIFECDFDCLTEEIMAATLKPYLNCVRSSLTAALCIQNFDSQLVERYNKPEVEISSGREIEQTPLVVARNEKEKVLIETSFNSVRVTILMDKFSRILMQRAEKFSILRRKPVDGYTISLLITNMHTEDMYKHKLVDFIIQFMEEVDKEVSDLKLAVNARARICAAEFLKSFS